MDHGGDAVHGRHHAGSVAQIDWTKLGPGRLQIETDSQIPSGSADGLTKLDQPADEMLPEEARCPGD
jgi:hypothetical protein